MDSTLPISSHSTSDRKAAWLPLPTLLRADSRIYEAQALIRRNLHRKINVEELATAAGLSVSGFSHLFKNESGVPPVRYVKQLRLQTAKELLEDSRLNVKEVAGQVGLDASRLVKEFREAFGLTPLQYRRLHQTFTENGRTVGGRNQLPSSPGTGDVAESVYE